MLPTREADGRVRIIIDSSAAGPNGPGGRGVEGAEDLLAGLPGPAGFPDWGAGSNVVGGCPVGRAGRPQVQFKLGEDL